MTMAATQIATRAETAPDFSRHYQELVAGGESPAEAAMLTDLAVVEHCLRRRLGRPPTEQEVWQAFRKM